LDELALVLANLPPTFSVPPIITDPTVLPLPPPPPSPTIEGTTGTTTTNSIVRQPPTSVFIGQSGTGKSSILNAMIPGLDLQVRELSRKILRGKHTTTASTLHQIPSGGLIIDSPGFDNFFPVPVRNWLLDDAFVEFKSLKRNCKFKDCHHRAEPECAIKAALEKGEIRQSRYDSYLRMLRVVDEFHKHPYIPRPSREERLNKIRLKRVYGEYVKDQKEELLDIKEDRNKKKTMLLHEKQNPKSYRKYEES